MSTAPGKPRVLVLGSFTRTAGDDRIGGMGFACQALVASSLSRDYDFLLVDSTLRSIRVGSFLSRLPAAASRLLRSLWHLGPGRAQAALCFAGPGASFVEKGCLVIAGSLLGRRMYLLPRSGHLVGQIGRSRLFRWFARSVLRRAHGVVCQSESWRQYYSGLAAPVDRHKFVVVENWLPAEALVAPEAACAGSATAGGFLVGYMNRIERDKGVFDYIEAVREAHAADPQIRGVIYGDGSALDEVRKKLAGPALAGIIEYRGWLDGAGKREALRGLDAYLFVSHAEGFPNSLLEVLGLKVPVVSVRVGAVTDVLEDARSALLADIGDSATLARQLLLLAHAPELRSSLADRAYQRIRDHNTLECAVQRFREILR